MEIDYKEIGRRIALRRKTLGLKQAQVCELCDINDKYLSNIEHARSIPSLDVLLRICGALDTTPNVILLGVESPSMQDKRKQITARLNSLDGRKLSLVEKFVDWIMEQDV